MAVKRVFLAELPGDPLSDYLKATLSLAPTLRDADGAVLPRLTKAAGETLAAALADQKPAYLPAEALPRRPTPALTQGLSILTGRGLILCPLTALPGWVQKGTSCRELLTLERLKRLAARGFDRVYLAGRPGATPLAAAEAKRRNIYLTGGNDPWNWPK